MGSGGTGRSSGVVRCHYGVRSLAAMAWRSLPILAGAPEVLGLDAGYRCTGYLVGVGPGDVDALRANVCMQRELGIEVELFDAATARQLWPGAALEDFGGFAYEPLGGCGDGHQTAQAFAEAARRGGAHIAQHQRVHALSERGGRITGVELVHGGHVGADGVVVAAGPWSVDLAAGVGVKLPIRAQRAQVHLVDPGTELGPVPVLSDLVSLQYVRPEGHGGGGPLTLLVGNSDHSDPEWSDPDSFSDSPEDAHLVRAIRKFEHRFPCFTEARLQSSYAGCYDVTPDYNPIISGTEVEGLWICAGFSGHGYKISPSVGELAADLVTSGTSSVADVDHRDFRLDRFDSGELLVSPHPYAGAAQMR